VRDSIALLFYVLFIYLFVVSSYTKYTYNNRTPNTRKMKKKLETTVKKIKIK